MFFEDIETLNDRMQPLFENQLFSVVFGACLTQCAVMMEEAERPHPDIQTWLYLSRQILAEMRVLVDSREPMRES